MDINCILYLYSIQMNHLDKNDSGTDEQAHNLVFLQWQVIFIVYSLWISAAFPTYIAFR